MASTITIRTGSADELAKVRMIVAIDILLKAFIDLPDIEMRLMKAKEQVLFNQENPSLHVIENINEAYKALIAQLPLLRKGTTP